MTQAARSILLAGLLKQPAGYARWVCIVLLWKNYHHREDFELSIDNCFGCGQSRATFELTPPAAEVRCRKKSAAKRGIMPERQSPLP
jgi:hypothetical protein